MSNGVPAKRQAHELALPSTEPLEFRGRLREITASAWKRARASLDHAEFSRGGHLVWLEAIAGTHFEEEIRLRGDSMLKEMAWTTLLADEAVSWILERERDPLLLASAVSQVVGNSLYTFEQPGAAGKRRHLSTAKRHGTFFTPVAVALSMARSGLAGRTSVDHVLEPAAGTGMLSAALLIEAHAQGIPVAHVELWELSPRLAATASATLAALVERLGTGTEVITKPGDAFVQFDALGYAPDVVVLNPPYGRVKFLRDSLTNTETIADDVHRAEAAERRRMHELHRSLTARATDLGIAGRGIDLQSLFISSTARALAPNGTAVIISPSSWVSGLDSAALRTQLLGSRQLRSLTLYAENAGLFDTVNQPTAVAVIDRGAPRTSFTLDYGNESAPVEIHFSDLGAGGRNPWQIPQLSAGQEQAYRALHSARRFRDDPNVSNLRGEVDLTADSTLLSSASTPFRLVRGDHVERYELRDSAKSLKTSHVSELGAELLLARPKGPHSQRPRIVGRQVSYLGKGRRLSFVEVPGGAFVANSCNYILGASSMATSAALATLNSAVLEWWFRVHSTNNHVANYEIDDLPWPELSDRASRALGALAQDLASPGLSGHDRQRREDLIDAIVCLALELSPATVAPVLRDVIPLRAEQVLHFLTWLARYGIPDSLLEADGLIQHDLPTLSAIDRAMIKSVPQGGNWTNIPVSIPSARLDQIRAMTAQRGIVRTSYYGRLRPDQPGYTIATYYNRPGNGTNIHPHEDRTLTHREAARLQSFRDQYTFMGPEGAIRKQIGNAVPPLLGSAVGRALLSAGYNGPVADLFAGAGGLSAGLEEVGHSVAIAVDNDQHCERTYTFNRPTEAVGDPNSARTLFVRSDLSDPVARESTVLAMKQKLGARRLSVLVGGPPCQGYSHAGFRSETDVRNDLAVVFMDFVRIFEPRAVVMENVEGILSYNRGQVVRDLVLTLQEMGYATNEPWLLAAEQYGVPQMRRRVFIVATKDAPVDVPTPRLQRCRGRREKSDDVVATGLPYPFTAEEALRGLPALGPTTHPNTGERDIRSALGDYLSHAAPISHLWGHEL